MQSWPRYLIRPWDAKQCLMTQRLLPEKIGEHLAKTLFFLCVLGFSCGSAGKESTCYVGDLGSVPGLGRSLGEVNGYPLQYSGLENSLDSIVHGVAELTQGGL